MHVVIDLTNSPHVPLFAPIVRHLEREGHRVTVTARRFAQTVELARMHDLDVTVIGAHGGASRLGKGRAAVGRTVALTRLLRRLHRREPITAGLSHGSTDLPIACRLLRVPHVTMFDYEWAATMHRLNCRLSARVVTPDAIPPERLAPYGAAAKLVQYPGLKEEYYLHDTRLDPAVREQLGIEADELLAVLRPPPELALYHRGRHNEVFDAVIERIRATERAVVVVLARTDEQRAALAARHLGADAPATPGRVVLPAHAVDAQSLIAAADLVISAGGTMNREAVALDTPVYTVFAGRMGAVDEQLIAQGRLRRLDSADAVDLTRRHRDPAARPPTLRDPAGLIDLALDGLPGVPAR